MFKQSFLPIALLLALPVASYAQDNSEQRTQAEVTDEVIAYGRRGQSGNRAMAAFNAGDYATAEVEFENHYNSLKRSERAVRRAARLSSDADISQQILTGPGDVGGASVDINTGNVLPVSINPSSSNAASQSNVQTITSLNADGKINYEDFGFSRYMSGLSQIQLGKFAEAKESFGDSLDHNYRNYDARMRLGLLELRDGNFEAAAKHLQKLDKLRKTCGDRCEDAEALKEATLTLAKALGTRRS